MRKPWRLEIDTDDGIHVPHCHVWGPRVTVQDHGSARHNPELLADMRLIAAAPELLEMLKQARCYVASFASNRDDARAEAVRDDVDAAIAKAEGR